MKHAGWIGLSIWLMVSCSFDQDDGSYPITKAAYILLADSLEQNKRILRVNQNVFEPNWQLSFGINQVSDITGLGNLLWLANVSSQQIAQVDLAENQIQESFNTAPLFPHYICVGTDYVLISDTVNQALGFLRLKNGALTQRSLDRPPGMASYRSGRFYVRVGKFEIVAWQEQALANIGNWTFTHQIVDIQQDNMLSTYIYTKDTALFQSAINYNTLQLDRDELAVTFDKIRHTPYQNVNFGKEYLSNVFLTGSRLSMRKAPEANDFEVDFFESNIYLQYGDSLYAYLIPEDKNIPLGQLSGKMLKAHYLREPIGK